MMVFDGFDGSSPLTDNVRRVGKGDSVMKSNESIVGEKPTIHLEVLFYASYV